MVRHCRGICGCSKSCWMALKVEIASVQEPDYVGPWGREKDAARPPFFFSIWMLLANYQAQRIRRMFSE